MSGATLGSVGRSRHRQLLVRVMAVLIAVAAALGAVAMPADAAEPFDLRIDPESTSRYLEPGASYTNLGFCTTEPAYISVEIRDAGGALVKELWNELYIDYAVCGSTYAYASGTSTTRRERGCPTGCTRPRSRPDRWLAK